jgi:hypothetical protein
MKQRKRVAAVIAAASSAVLFAATAAQADTGVFRTSDNWPHGGAASFVSYGDRLNLCDTQADGAFVTAYVYDSDGFNFVYDIGEHAGNGHCTHADATMGGKHNLAEGHPYWFKVCVRTDDYCSGVISARA